mmetsp:Transcript_124150/g.345598  ORF Transcript_124150/g.345598 Transcript_124150/m.345598 type:complete len:247 (+) Transcript_124150:452-1192(+)
MRYDRRQGQWHLVAGPRQRCVRLQSEGPRARSERSRAATEVVPLPFRLHPDPEQLVPLGLRGVRRNLGTRPHPRGGGLHLLFDLEDPALDLAVRLLEEVDPVLQVIRPSVPFGLPHFHLLRQDVVFLRGKAMLLRLTLPLPESSDASKDPARSGQPCNNDVLVQQVRQDQGCCCSGQRHVWERRDPKIDVRERVRGILVFGQAQCGDIFPCLQLLRLLQIHHMHLLCETWIVGSPFSLPPLFCLLV